MYKSDMNKGLHVSSIDIGEDKKADIIFDCYGNVILWPDNNDVYNIVHSRDKNYIFEIKSNNKIRYEFYRYYPEEQELKLIESFNEKLETVFIESNDSLLLFEDERDRSIKKELYSLNRERFVTPKVDNIERIDHEDNIYFIFEDIDYRKDIDRENHIYGFLDKDGNYKGYIYDYDTDTKHEVDIYSEPFFMKYYTLRMQLDKEFNKHLEEQGFSKIKK